MSSPLVTGAEGPKAAPFIQVTVQRALHMACSNSTGVYNGGATPASPEDHDSQVGKAWVEIITDQF